MTADNQTLAFYDGEAAAYADYSIGPKEPIWLAEFSARLEPGTLVLDFGCGSGWAANTLARDGFRVSALDGSAGLAAEARQRYGIDVRVARFEALDDDGLYGGIWASFCLLHDTRDAMPGHMARLHRALVPAGLLYLGLKEGEGESRDKLGRRYTFFRQSEIELLLGEAEFSGIEVTAGPGIGYDGANDGMMHIFARRSA